MQKSFQIKFNPKDNTLSFGKFGKLKFQQGSLSNHKRNGVVDTDVIAGLSAYLETMNKQHASDLNTLAAGNLNSAFVFLQNRRNLQHLQDKEKKSNDDKK